MKFPRTTSNIKRADKVLSEFYQEFPELSFLFCLKKIILLEDKISRHSPARLVPHSAVYAASALPMELPPNFHGQSALKVRQSALKVRNDIHQFKNLAA
jgi:hypothetical protein